MSSAVLGGRKATIHCWARPARRLVGRPCWLLGAGDLRVQCRADGVVDGNTAHACASAASACGRLADACGSLCLAKTLGCGCVGNCDSFLSCCCTWAHAWRGGTRVPGAYAALQTSAVTMLPDAESCHTTSQPPPPQHACTRRTTAASRQLGRERKHVFTQFF